MSIRVTKMLGYGLRDLRTRKKNPKDKFSSWVPRDPRWDYAKYLTDWRAPHGDGDPEKERNLKHYLAWCEANEEHLLALTADERGIANRTDHYLLVEGIRDRITKKDTSWAAPYSAVQWNTEGGLKNVVMFVPAEFYHEWRRYDDILDYYEEQSTRGLRRRATPLVGRAGIWPHNGMMKRFRLPKKDVAERLSALSGHLQAMSRDIAANRDLDGADISRLPERSYNRIVGLWDHRIPSEIEDPEAIQHFKEDWRLVVPMGVLALIEYLGCFPDAYGPDGIVNSLRPMIYVYWRYRHRARGRGRRGPDPAWDWVQGPRRRSDGAIKWTSLVVASSTSSASPQRPRL